LFSFTGVQTTITKTTTNFNEVISQLSSLTINFVPYFL